VSPTFPRWPREQGSRGGIVAADRSSLPGRTAMQCRTLHPMLPRPRDERCPSGSGWGEAPVIGAAFGRDQRVTKTDASHDERRRAARAGRPLTRETSADVGRKPFENRKAREGQKRRCHPDSAVDVADGAPTPSGGLPPSPARAGRDPSAGMDRGSGDRAVVLVDCSGCRSRREASGPSRSPRWATSVEGVGSSHPASCSGGKRASEAGSRRRSRENGGGLSTIPEGGASRSAGE
jgi:hypothetical protein